ncbi:RagB/SusD family nutrient uptake outer membrane protein [Pedobacter nyackensis]|uniref:Starch-binding associating with outer membrane n=1 Tax=Pedobacter nyackensis TaxID=475255 RepID=A0A1W2CKV8_9SPHI|nr:RagB/SusD family nutrient uptake outer membrane protein [Pedobacter nyackensis]SMC85877.1 Starch-binding associating with outer membrane [Pedobacter nyackensis]
MNKINISLLVIVFVLGISACRKAADLLDKTETTDLNKEKTFSDSTLTHEFLTGLYADVAFNWEYRKYASTRSGNTDVTDDAISASINNGAIHPIVSGTLSPMSNSPYTTSWSVPYKSIRLANVFLANVNRSPLSAAKIKRLRAEARFLRAWYYVSLLRYFGGIPLIGDAVIDVNHEFREKRSTYEETVNYIVAELAAAAPDLPPGYLGNDFGRTTRGAALALKARVLLYAASPLFNGGNIGAELGAGAEKTAVAGYVNYDKSRWLLAQKAALDVMNLNVYSLYTDPDASTNPAGYSFSRVFLKRMNNEYIMQYNLPLNRDLEADFFAPSRNSSLRSMPTHNLAQAFGMINGKGINEQGSAYNKDNPFSNRDPRFNYTLAFNGTLWHNGPTNTKIPVYTYVGAALDGFNTRQYHTGYFWRKMQEENTAWNGGSNTERCLPIIRYAEVLLSYAEASNELNEISKAYDQLKLIRQRAGILPGADGLYGLKPNMNADEMRVVLQNERRVEFAFEEHRFWDLRRWKIAEQALNNLQLEALKVTRISNNVYTYEVLPINHANSKLKFLKPNYLFPIDQLEIDKNQSLIQNPGY